MKFLYLCFNVSHAHNLHVCTITTNSTVNIFHYLKVREINNNFIYRNGCAKEVSKEIMDGGEKMNI